MNIINILTETMQLATIFMAIHIIYICCNRDDLDNTGKITLTSGWIIAILYIALTMCKTEHTVSVLSLKLNISIILTLLLVIYLMFRNAYTYKASKQSLIMITGYLHFLIDEGKFNPCINYYEEMRYSYSRYMLSLFKFKAINMIKPKYRDTIREFIKTDYYKEYEENIAKKIK